MLVSQPWVSHALTIPACVGGDALVASAPKVSVLTASPVPSSSRHVKTTRTGSLLSGRGGRSPSRPGSGASV